MTEKQEKCYDSFIGKATDCAEYDEEAERLCLRFWYSLFKHELRGPTNERNTLIENGLRYNQYENPLFGGAALLGWDRDWQEFKGPHAFKDILSSILKVIPMIVVFKVYKKRIAVAPSPQVGLIAQKPASKVEQLNDEVRRIITPSTLENFRSPYNYFLEMQWFAMTSHANVPYQVSTSWKDDLINIKTVKLTMVQMRLKVHKDVEELNRELDRDLLFLYDGASRPGLDLHSSLRNVLSHDQAIVS